MNKIETRVKSQEAHSRRLNLIFNNIPETDNEDIREVVNKVFIDNLKIQRERATGFLLRDLHRLGNGKNQQSNVSKKYHRAIIVAFVCQTDRNDVFNCARNLQGSSITMRIDLPPEYSKVRDNLLIQRKAIKDYNKKIIAVIKYRSYRPFLFVKVNGDMVHYKEEMNVNSLEIFTNDVNAGRHRH